jgi:hypothetical protein
MSKDASQYVADHHERVARGRAHSSSSEPYTAKLIGWSDEEAAVRVFPRIVDAIRWLTAALEDGALAKRASIYSAKGELVWNKPGTRSGKMREHAMKQNAQRLFIQLF